MVMESKAWSMVQFPSNRIAFDVLCAEQPVAVLTVICGALTQG